MANRNTPSVLVAALEYLKRGWQPIPIPSREKAPHLKDWPNLRFAESDLAAHFQNGGNVGVLLGEPSGGLVDIDLDAIEALVVADAFLPSTERIHGRKAKPRSHRWYATAQPPRPEKFADSDGTCLVEVRSTGQQTVLPPSVHPSGEPLRWERDGDPAVVDGADLRRRVARAAAASLLGRHWPAKGQRHDAALALAGMLLRGGWRKNETKTLVLGVALAAHDEEFRSRLGDVMSSARQLANNQPCTGTPTLVKIIGEDAVSRIREWLQLPSEVPAMGSDSLFHLTDVGNACRLAAQHGDNLRYCHPWGKWFVWHGTRWMLDETGQVEHWAKDTIKSVYSEASRVADSAERKRLADHAMRSESERSIHAMVSLVKSEPHIPATPNEFDVDAWLLNCLNGTLDLCTGRLLPHSKENLCSKQVPVSYDCRASSPTWDRFLDRIMDGNQSHVEFLKRAVGYSLTGQTTEQVLFLLHGTGANGKTTFVRTIQNLLGDYAQQADFETFLVKRNEGPRNDLARLKGARFVAAVEVGEGRRLAETTVKQVTGSDAILARFLYHELFQFVPQFKLFLVANHKPRVVGTDEAIWRRIRLVPFTVTIPPEERDKRLLEGLRRELSGILSWAVCGCLDWQRHGLGEPPEVSEATAAYRREMDVVADFINERCVVAPGEFATAAILYRAYKQWSEENGEVPLTQRRLGTELHQRGYRDGKRQGQRSWFGVRPRREGENVDGLDGMDANSTTVPHG